MSLTSLHAGARALAVAAGLAIAFGACDEKLESGIACPSLCPQPPATVRDTTLFPVVFDTSIVGFPETGDELRIPPITAGDTLETRGVVRFDSLPTTFRHVNSVTDSAIIAVDTGAYIRFLIEDDSTTTEPTTIEAYDVDVGDVVETDPSAVNSAFTPDRLIGTRVVPPDSMRDSLVIPIDPAVILAKVQATPPGNRLRVGLRATRPSGSATVLLFTVNSASSPLLVFRPSTESDVPTVFKEPQSETGEAPFAAESRRDYVVVGTGPPDPAADVLRVGGIPGRRIYMRFDIPKSILDSGSVVRATLAMTQAPTTESPGAGDTLSIEAVPLTATSSVTDLRRALLLPLRVPICPVAPLRLVPVDGGEFTAEVINVMRCWAQTDADLTPRALAFFSDREGVSGSFVELFSSEAGTNIGPRLHITYVPRRQATFP